MRSEQDTLWNLVRRVRKVTRQPQYVLAKASDIERTRLSLFECGHIHLRAEKCERLEAALREIVEGRLAELETLLRGELAVSRPLRKTFNQSERFTPGDVS